MNRIGNWMQTFRGGQFWPLDPRADEVHIEDIAHALSMQCRFAGHCEKFYSVAEHSVRVSQIVPKTNALQGLLHDASEAYLVDLPSPVKKISAIGKHYMKAEADVERVIGERFGVTLIPMPIAVKTADIILLMTEARDLMKKPPTPWDDSTYRPLEQVIEPWTSAEAEEEFLLRFEELYK